MRKLFFPCVMLFLLCVFHVRGAHAAASPSLSEIFMASGVNADGSPQARVTVYSPEASLLAAFAECRNAAAGTTVRFSWYYAPPGRDRIPFAEYAAKNAARRKTALFHSTVSLEKDWPEGDYLVEVRLDGDETIQKLAFSVKKGAGASAGQPEGDAKNPLPTKRENDERGVVYHSAKDAAREREERAEKEKALALKETAFRKNPADFFSALELADAYAAMNDAASASLALALYEGLAESSPSDMILARLADAYARLYRYDRAFTTALRRTWNPRVSPEGAVSQILLLALAGGDLDRGIDCLLHVLAERDDERETTLLALAALYIEKAGAERDRSLREEYRSAAAKRLDEAEPSLPRFSAMTENLLRLRKELEKP